MTEYAVAHLDEIEELDDGREPLRPVRHHFGITSFGVKAWTGREAGDRIINEHDESPRRPETARARSSTSSCPAAPCSSSTASGSMRLPAPSSSPLPP